MNLNENIQRIHQMMGLISEDKKVDFAKKMIDTLGVRDAIKYYGGYDNFKKYMNFVYDRKNGKWVHASELQTPNPVDFNTIITREDKIGFIKDAIFLQHYGLFTYGDEGWDESEYSVLKSTESYDKVAFAYYDDKLSVTTFYRDENGEFSGQTEKDDEEEIIKYEDLPDDMLDKAFDFIAKKS